jgi:hypothetical protein
MLKTSHLGDFFVHNESPEQMQSNLVLQRAEPGRGEVMFFRVVPASSLSLHLRPVIQTT